MKECTKCKEIKSIEEFYKDKNCKDGHQSLCKGCFNEIYKIWRKKYPEKIKEWYKTHFEYNKKYYKNNSDKWKRFRKNNPEKYKEYSKKSYKTRKLNPTFHLSRLISESIRYSLKGNKNGLRWETLVNYTLQDLKIRLEKLFKPGMSWKNQGKNGWYIDHIIPVSLWKFDSYDEREFKQCFALCNLQPLWANENSSKGNRV